MVHNYSINSWNYFNPVNIIFGENSLSQINNFLKNESNIFLITSPSFSKNGIVDKLSSLLSKKNLIIFDQITPNPTSDEIDNLFIYNKNKNIEVVIALGGGSVIDTAKIFSYMYAKKSNLSILELINSGHDFNHKKEVKLLVIPTTAGTGSEVTPFATIWDDKKKKKFSASGFSLFPDFAILDPFLLNTLSYNNILYPALDSISHALESLWNKNSTQISILFALKALFLAERNLNNALNSGDINAKSCLLEASNLSGLAISQTKTAIAHSISYPLTINYGVPHGLASSFTLVELLKINYNFLSNLSSGENIFLKIETLLSSLNLAKHILDYVNLDQILSLSNEMNAKDRLENYTGVLPSGINGLIKSSLC